MGTELWIWGGTALLPERPGGVLEDSAIGVCDSKIVYVGTRAQAQPSPKAKKIDANGCLVMPGLVNGHTHSGMALMRGLYDDLPLQEWLFQKIFPFEKKWGSPEFVYWASLLATAEMIRSGTTVFNDMYYFAGETIRASTEAGLRVVAGQSLTESSDIEDAGRDLIKNFDLFLETHGSNPLLTISLSPHAIYSVSRNTWKQVIEYTKKHSLRMQFHLSETEKEMADSLKEFGKTPTQYLESLGAFEVPLTAAHVAVLTPEDIQILGKYGVGIAYNPESNMKLGNPAAPIVELRQAGARAAFATDGAASSNNLDMLEAADFGTKLQSFKYGPGRFGAKEAFAMLTEEGAHAVGLGGRIGKLEVGREADIIAVDVTGPHAVPLYNPYSHLVYSASGRDVKHSVVAGQILMENRNLLTLDEQEILREAASWARRFLA